MSASVTTHCLPGSQQLLSLLLLLLLLLLLVPVNACTSVEC